MTYRHAKGLVSFIGAIEEKKGRAKERRGESRPVFHHFLNELLRAGGIEFVKTR